jgi:hypothetical protein
VEIIERPEAAEARERRETAAAQREKDDLLAQQGMNTATQAMNEATQDMALDTRISAGLAFIGTLLLVWTLFETRRALSVTRRIGQAQVRAYITVEGVPDIPRIEAGNPLAGLSVRNTGQPPPTMSVSCKRFSWTTSLTLLKTTILLRPSLATSLRT